MEFANQKALIDYAEQNGLAYVWRGLPAFSKRQRELSPEQYEIVDVRTSRGMNQAMLFSKESFQPLHLRGARIIRRETPAVHGGGRVSHITEPPAQRLPPPREGGRPD